jgi:hypothetical protein
MSPRTLRVVTFRALGPDSAVDAVLRTVVLPRLVDAPDVVDAWQGRRGAPDGSHVLASTWIEPPRGAFGDPLDVALLRDPQLVSLGGTELVSVEETQLAVHARFSRPEPARLMRVFHGQARPGELDDYIDEARAGMTADAQINDGLVSYVLGRVGDDAFVSVSTWTGWAAIEAATGGDTRHPFATRNSGRLAEYRVAHLELLPEAPVARSTALDPRLEPAT